MKGNNHYYERNAVLIHAMMADELQKTFEGEKESDRERRFQQFIVEAYFGECENHGEWRAD